MKLGGRIAIYFLLCALWAGFLFGAAALRYDETARRIALDAEYNQELLRHQAKMKHLNAVYECMKVAPSLGEEGCEAHVSKREAAAKP